MSTSRVVSRGLIAGIIAATVVAIWFLLVDALAGDPMRTPGFLAGAAMGSGEGEAGFGNIAVYTILHYVVFAVIGVLVASILARTRTPPMLLLGLVLGVFLFDLVFYGGVVLRGVDVIDAVGWPALLAGNLLGGVALMAWLRRSSPEPVGGWRDALRQNRTLREGLVAGLIGGVAVALWFLLYDVLTREPFFTPAALGSAVLEGARGIDAVVISATTVVGYTTLHFLAFLALGMIAALLAAQAERNAVVILAAMLLFVTAETLFLGLAAVAANWLLDALTWWNVIAANLVAAVSMGVYLWRAHPRLADQLRHSNIEEESVGNVREPTSTAR